MSTNIKIQRRCEYCYQEFTARTTITRFCSHTCNSRNYKANVKALKIARSNEETVAIAKESQRTLLEKELLTIADAVTLLDISNKGVYELINTGKLKALKLTARNTRIRRADFLEFLNTRAVKPAHVEAPSKIQETGALTKKDCYSVNELTAQFNKSRDALYVMLRRAGVSKIKIGKEVFFSKAESDSLFRKFASPRPLGHDKERMANLKLKNKGFAMVDCYTMEQCELLFNQKRGNLYNKFNRRQVPKIRLGHIAYYLKKSVDKIYHSIKEGGEQ